MYTVTCASITFCCVCIDAYTQALLYYLSIILFLLEDIPLSLQCLIFLLHVQKLTVQILYELLLFM